MAAFFCYYKIFGRFFIKIPTNWYFQHPYGLVISFVIKYAMEGFTIMGNLKSEQQTDVKEKPLLRCYKCSTVYHYKARPNWFFRTFLFFLPIKGYFCARCLKTRNIWITDKEEKKYKPV